MDNKLLWLKSNLPMVLCSVLIVLLFLLAQFYFEPLYQEEITLENALYEKWASFSALILVMLIFPKCLRAAGLVILIGSVLNATAIAANDGYMPVASSACIYVEGNHMPMHEGVRLPILCDWVLGVMSIGDLFLLLGLPLVLIASLRFMKEVDGQ